MLDHWEGFVDRPNPSSSCSLANEHNNESKRRSLHQEKEKRKNDRLDLHSDWVASLCSDEWIERIPWIDQLTDNRSVRPHRTISTKNDIRWSVDDILQQKQIQETRKKRDWRWMNWTMERHLLVVDWDGNQRAGIRFDWRFNTTDFNWSFFFK